MLISFDFVNKLNTSQNSIVFFIGSLVKLTWFNKGKTFLTLHNFNFKTLLMMPGKKAYAEIKIHEVKNVFYY